MLEMAAILSWLASMPRSDTMDPRSLPFGTTNVNFFGIFLDVKPPEVSECGAQGGDQVICAWSFDNDVVHVNRDRWPRQLCPIGVRQWVDLVGEAGLHTTLVRCARVLKPERHRDITVRAVRGDEGCRELVDSFIAIW